MAKTRRPPISSVQNAGRTLAQALRAESERVREREGHSGHVQAQELMHDASRVGGMVSQVEALRRYD